VGKIPVVIIADTGRLFIIWVFVIKVYKVGLKNQNKKFE
jgi:hypothetical protein